MSNKSHSQINWYHKSMEIFIKISGFIAIPIIIALFLGNWLDEKYGTTNRYLVICVIVAFLITNIGLLKEVYKYNKQLKEIEKKDE